jgi:hypothetical protein
VDAGRDAFLVANLEDLDLGDRRFDKIFAVRVGLFYREPERARGIAERRLAPGGALFASSISLRDRTRRSGLDRVPPSGRDRRNRKTGGEGARE